jgi:hypothetical protein
MTFYPGNRIITDVTNTPNYAVLRPRSNAGTITDTNGVGWTNEYSVVSGQVYNISMFLNDDINAINYEYAIAGVTNIYTLNADSADYWVNDTLLATNALLQTTKASLTTNGLGRFGFNSGTAQSNINFVVDDIKVTSLSGIVELPPTNSWPTNAWLFEDFEYPDVVGSKPTAHDPLTSTVGADYSINVIASSSNSAGRGQALQFYDTNAAASPGFEYNFKTNGATTVRASFAFTWNNDITGTDSSYVSFDLGAFSNSATRLINASANRYTDGRLCADGTVDFRSSNGTNNSMPLVAGAANTMTLFANDHDTDAASYTINGTAYSLPANSVAYWMNGSLVMMNTGLEYAPLDVNKLNYTTGNTIGTSTNNLGRFGFAANSSSVGTDFVIDDILVSDIPAAPLYSVSVNGASGSGFYENGAPVVVMANKLPGKTFVGWIGDTQVLANASSSSNTFAMSTTPVNLTAVYDSATLTIVVGSGGLTYSDGGPRVSATYTSGQVVEIIADAPAADKMFKSWTGDVSYVANITSSTTTVTMPGYDITITSSYKTATYYLTVDRGSGDGSYTNGAEATISANVYTGKVFVAWTGEVAQVLDVNAETTTVAISNFPITVGATFANAPGWYTLTVTSGSGDTTATNGTAVEIVANAPPTTNEVFNVWTGDVSFVANVNAETTTVTLAGQNVAVYATYKPASVNYDLTGVVSGGNGTISPTSTNVPGGSSVPFTITANSNYRIATLTTNGESAGVSFDNDSTSYIYTWIDVQAAGTVTVSFVAQVTTNAPAPVPYEWLAIYFVTNDYNACALADQDADGMKTWQEYIAGTIPNNATSLLKAAQAPRNVVTWSPVTGRVYSVYWSTNLVKGITNMIADNIVHPQGSYTNTAPDSRVNHYQVKVRLQ